MAVLSVHKANGYGKYGAAPTVAAPTNLRQTASTSSSITLAWDGVAGTYTLQRATVTNGAVGTYANVSPGPGTAKTYQDMGLTYQGNYAYRVQVTVNGVASGYSTVLRVSLGDLTVSVDSQRVATMTLPSGTTASNYEYQFRPGPAVSAARQVDMTQTLAAGESATDYEYQSR